MRYASKERSKSLHVSMTTLNVNTFTTVGKRKSFFSLLALPSNGIKISHQFLDNHLPSQLSRKKSAYQVDPKPDLARFEKTAEFRPGSEVDASLIKERKFKSSDQTWQ